MSEMGDASGGARRVLNTSENSKRLRRFGDHEIAGDVPPRVSGRTSAERRAARPSIRSATDGDTSSRCDDGSSGNGTCDDRAGCDDAARPIDAGSTDDGVGG
jgi:hypothetical protein